MRDKRVLIFRYLTKEVFITMLALTLVLLLTFMSNQVAIYLKNAANGQFPLMLVFKLLMVELPTFTMLLLPLGFYVALLLAYGRLYADSEMTVLNACGYGQKDLLKHSYIMVLPLVVIVSIISLWGTPLLAMEREKLLRTIDLDLMIQAISPGHFQPLSSGRQILYVSKMSQDHHQAHDVFWARQTVKQGQLQWDILWANKAMTEIDANTHESYIVLQDAKAYQGVPGQADYRWAEFERYKIRMPHPTFAPQDTRRLVSTNNLLPWNNADLKKAAELQWRLSIPLLLLVLTLLAVPLSRVNPRAGKFANLLPAIIIFIIYANFLFIARNWFEHEKTPVWLGLWWIHVPAIILGLLLLWRQHVKLS